MNFDAKKTEDLKLEARALCDAVYIAEVYSVDDLVRLDKILQELDNRGVGFDIRPEVTA
jgi:hypothetical protein